MKSTATRPCGIAAVLVLAAAAVAQGSAYIPSNTPTVGTCNVAPFGRMSSIQQSIASPAELGNTTGLITDLAFAPCQTATIAFDTLEIVMAHTSATTLSTTFSANLAINPITVLKATKYVWPVIGNQWNRIGLDTPYLYLPSQGSLVVQIILSGSTGGGNGMHRDTGQRVYVMDWTGTPPATGTSYASMLKWEVVFSGSDASPFGLGCAGSNQKTPALGLTGNGKLGTSLSVDLSNALANAPTFLALDVSRTEPAIDLGIAGAPGCRMYVLNAITLGGVCDALGSYSFQGTIPATVPPGIRVYWQFFPFDKNANKLGLTASNYGRVLTGM